MPISKLLPVGTAAAESSPLVLGTGAVVSLLLRGSGAVLIEALNSDGAYESLGEVNDGEKVRQMQGPLTIRARRNLVVPKWVPAGQAPETLSVGLDAVTE